MKMYGIDLDNKKEYNEVIRNLHRASTDLSQAYGSIEMLKADFNTKTQKIEMVNYMNQIIRIQNNLTKLRLKLKKRFQKNKEKK